MKKVIVVLLASSALLAAPTAANAQRHDEWRDNHYSELMEEINQLAGRVDHARADHTIRHSQADDLTHQLSKIRRRLEDYRASDHHLSGPERADIERRLDDVRDVFHEEHWRYR
jgi:hypothetical protein